MHNISAASKYCQAKVQPYGRSIVLAFPASDPAASRVHFLFLATIVIDHTYRNRAFGSQAQRCWASRNYGGRTNVVRVGAEEGAPRGLIQPGSSFANCCVIHFAASIVGCYGSMFLRLSGKIREGRGHTSKEFANVCETESASAVLVETDVQLLHQN